MKTDLAYNLRSCLVRPPAYSFPEISKLRDDEVRSQRLPHGLNNWRWGAAKDLADCFSVRPFVQPKVTDLGIWGVINKFSNLNLLTEYTQRGVFQCLDLKTWEIRNVTEIKGGEVQPDPETTFIHHDLALRIITAMRLGYVEVEVNERGVVYGKDRIGNCETIKEGKVIVPRFRLNNF